MEVMVLHTQYQAHQPTTVVVVVEVITVLLTEGKVV